MRIPFKDDNQTISMYVLLPENRPTAIDDLLVALTLQILDDLFNGEYYASLCSMYIHLPKFSMKNSRFQPSMLANVTKLKFEINV